MAAVVKDVPKDPETTTKKVEVAEEESKESTVLEVTLKPGNFFYSTILNVAILQELKKKVR